MKMIYILTLFVLNLQFFCAGMKIKPKTYNYAKILFDNLCTRFKESVYELFKENSSQEIILISCENFLPVIRAVLIATHFNTQEESITYYEVEDDNSYNNEQGDKVFLDHWLYECIKSNNTIKNLVIHVKKNMRKNAVLWKSVTQKNIFDYAAYPSLFIDKSNTAKNLIESFRNHVLLHYAMIKRIKQNK